MRGGSLCTRAICHVCVKFHYIELHSITGKGKIFFCTKTHISPAFGGDSREALLQKTSSHSHNALWLSPFYPSSFIHLTSQNVIIPNMQPDLHTQTTTVQIIFTFCSKRREKTAIYRNVWEKQCLETISNNTHKLKLRLQAKGLGLHRSSLRERASIDTWLVFWNIYEDI